MVSLYPEPWTRRAHLRLRAGRRRAARRRCRRAGKLRAPPRCHAGSWQAGPGCAGSAGAAALRAFDGHPPARPARASDTCTIRDPGEQLGPAACSQQHLGKLGRWSQSVSLPPCLETPNLGEADLQLHLIRHNSAAPGCGSVVVCVSRLEHAYSGLRPGSVPALPDVGPHLC